MMATLRELSRMPEMLVPGHRMCAGCGAPIVVRQVLRAAHGPVVVANATGCLEVSTTVYPFTSWQCPWIHTAFESTAASLSGVEAAYKSLKRQGKISQEIKFVAFGGDGGTYDIGLQSLSGALERGHKMVYVCYDNGAYMNTGIQRSSATPKGAETTTSPVGKVQAGKPRSRKDLTKIVAAHNIPYVAQVSPAHWNDLYAKAEKAFAADGPAFLNAIAPCPRGWRHDSSETIEMCRLAVDTCFWPLYEVENGKIRVTYKPKEKKPLVEFLKRQGRFNHLFKPGNEGLLEELQQEVDRQWEALLAQSES
ncbi:MAG: pyruvate ferredoxin oxidoreductase [Firmicutes bacterium]|nr:pyruvate ferredoxin oxidoreductase [Candidatus Fermentithermobacillaceae bacterium]